MHIQDYLIIAFLCALERSYILCGAVVVVIIWQLDLQLPMQSVPINIKSILITSRCN